MSARRLTWSVLTLTSLCLFPALSWGIDVKLLPEKTEIVVTVNIKQILNSEPAKTKDVQDVIKEIKGAFNQVPGSDQALKYLDKMGVDAAKDLTSLTLAHPASTNPEDLFLILEGNFDPAKIEATAQGAIKDFGNVLNISKIDTVTVVEFTSPQGGVFVGLLGNKTIVAAGTQNALKDAIARSTGKKPAVLKKDVEDLLKTFHDKQSVSFAVSSRALAAAQGGAAFGGAFPALDGGVTGSISLGKELTFQFGLVAKNKETASDLADKGNLALFAVRGLLNQQAQQNADLVPLADVVNSLRLFNMSNNLVLTGEVSYESLGKLFKNLANQFQGK
jgi:hypothetical protein